MKGPLGVLLTVAIAIGLTAAALFGLGDRSVLASPPESVVEDFMRKLETGRYVRARDDLSDDIAQQIGPDSLRTLLHALEARVGEIVDVRGERVWMTRGTARATAVLETDRQREVEIELPLVWASGEWSVSDLRGLERE